MQQAWATVCYVCYVPQSGMRQNCVGGANYHFWQQLFIKPFSFPDDNLWQMFHRYKAVGLSGLLSIRGH